MLKINESRCRAAEQTRTQWQVKAEQGMTPEDLLDPAVWANVARHMKRFDRIEAVAHDENWWAEYLVWDADKLWVKLEMQQHRFRPGAEEQIEEGEADEYSLTLRGARKWSVVRNADKEVIKDGFQTKADAKQHLDGLLRRVAA